MNKWALVDVVSGSEANELAVRQTRAFTGWKDIVVSGHGEYGILQVSFASTNLSLTEDACSKSRKTAFGDLSFDEKDGVRYPKYV